ncbi:PQQ-binding-like beta-propeller repeat protein [Lignipirellula cremea]|uniref:Outer membrane biogenesis protein BamB n=1 Tax=Lignipirellula cremea TaxID=2528010 RepID=A0A518E0Q2_9BACT|nr:PQQ-binding-like beta-propeller repeat protein [Lignipirellula cremea]QDU97676.1 outer membrane biogenesis protein BamB [Lignipirellula cremea]
MTKLAATGEPTTSAAASPDQRLPVLPPIRNRCFSAIFLAVGLVIWGFDLLGDHQAGKLVLLVACCAALLSPFIWFTFFSGRRGPKRFIPAALLLATIAAPFSVLRVDEFSGELMPHFNWRWAAKPDTQLEIPPTPAVTAETTPAVDMLTVTPYDFPGFFGPDRNLRVDSVSLNQDWQTHPPEKIWEHRIGAGWGSFAVVNGFAVTMEQRGERELVTCYEVETGKLRWSHGIDARYSTLIAGVGPRSTPTIDEGRVYALGATGVLRCLDGATGRQLWRKDLLQVLNIPAEAEAEQILYGRANSPLIVDQLVVVPGGGVDAQSAVSLIAFDKTTGDEVWRGGSDQISYASPRLATLLDQEQIVSVNESSVSGHDPATGKVLWQFEWEGDSATESNNSQPIPIGDDRLFISKGYSVGGSLRQLERDANNHWTVTEVWSNYRLMKTKFTSAVYADGYLYGLSDGILECVEAATGEQMWKKGRYHQGQILAVGNSLLATDELTGEVILVQMTPEGAHEKGRFQAIDSDKIWNNLAIYGPYLLVRDAQRAACWKLPLHTDLSQPAAAEPLTSMP